MCSCILLSLVVVRAMQSRCLYCAILELYLIYCINIVVMTFILKAEFRCNGKELLRGSGIDSGSSTLD